MFERTPAELIKHKIERLQATADRRLELLREIDAKSPICPICIRRLQSNVVDDAIGHADDCRLAKELSDG